MNFQKHILGFKAYQSRKPYATSFIIPKRNIIFKNKGKLHITKTKAKWESTIFPLEKLKNRYEGIKLVD